MIGDIDVRTSVRLIASAPELRLWRMPSAVTGSASGAAPEASSPARYTTASASAISVLVDVGYQQDAAAAGARAEAGVEVGRRRLLEQDRGAVEAGLGDRGAVDDRERQPLAARERPSGGGGRRAAPPPPHGGA